MGKALSPWERVALPRAVSGPLRSCHHSPAEPQPQSQHPCPDSPANATSAETSARQGRTPGLWSPGWRGEVPLGGVESQFGVGRALHRFFQSSRFSIHLASSLVLCAPASFLSTSTYVSVGRPRDQCPWVGSHSTNLLDGSSWCLWQRPASLILLAATFSLTLGIPSYRILLVTCVLLLMLSTAHSILV
ncbi:unnamed protein product [Gadus morhua 'NCC']